MDLPARFEKIGTKRILVCDDVYDNVLLLQFILEAEGYEVILADSGAVAIALIKRENPDLVLLDRVMPGIDGIETVRCIRQNPRNNSLPIILVVAGCRDTISAECQKLVDGVIHKPIECEELIAQIEAVFAAPSSLSDRSYSRNFFAVGM